MLTPMDDTLFHQLPTTFDHVGTSDQRFFDRYWFALYSPDGRMAMQVTMGAYRNMNVLDGAAVLVVDGKQHNLRVSRSLSRSHETECGPLSIHTLEPLGEFEIDIAPGEQAVSGKIRWRQVELAREERPHFTRLHGRAIEDYRRFDQIGVADGWLEVEGERIPIDDWWACRDHSWGVRRGMGITEPVTGLKPSLADKGHVMSFLFFSTEVMSGHLLFMRRGEDSPYTTGVVTERETENAHEASQIDLDIDLHPGTRRFRTATLKTAFSDGRALDLDLAAVGSSIAMQGLGYSGGFDDGRGLGAWRGEEHVEHETWDVSHPSLIVDAAGASKEHWHRIQPVRINAAMDGEPSVGYGSMTLTVSGQLPSYLDRSERE
jgi:hypothetical protein